MLTCPIVVLFTFPEEQLMIIIMFPSEIARQLYWGLTSECSLSHALRAIEK